MEKRRAEKIIKKYLSAYLRSLNMELNMERMSSESFSTVSDELNEFISH
ncbi:hypothetical protein [Caldiplasma sukawensis]